MKSFSGEYEKLWQAYTPPPVQPIVFSHKGPACSMVRLDLIRSWASGNKYFKLKHVLRQAIDLDIPVIVSKGGMFSNHLAALADACSCFGKQLVAVIRSHGADELNPSIRHLRSAGTEILFLSPEAYHAFDQSTAQSMFPGAMFIPEGGLSREGISGAAEIAATFLVHKPTHVIVSGGTLGTACGLLSGIPAPAELIIVPAWKGCTDDYVYSLLNSFAIKPSCPWQIWPDSHFGGFGKFDARLVEFMTSFSNDTGIPLDPVYTGKMMYGCYEKIKQGYFTASDHILAIHTGGLQGLEGFRYRYPEQWGSYLKDLS